MGLSLDAIRKRVAELEAGPGKKTTWKPKDEHIVRCLESGNEDEFGREVGFHYGVDQGRRMYCPGTDGDDCSFCALADSLRSWRDENGNEKPEAVRKQDFDWFKKIQRAVKHYVPIVVRKDDGGNEGPLWWEMSPRTYGDLLKICMDDDWNKMHKHGGGSKILTHQDEGLDLVVSLAKAGQKGNKTSFDLTNVKERKMLSPLVKGGDAKALLERIPAFSTAVKPMTSEEARKVFAEFEASLTKGAVPTAKESTDVEYTVPSHNAERLEGKESVDDVMAKLQSIVDKKR